VSAEPSISWNEFMLVESLALRDPNIRRALAIENRFGLNTNAIRRYLYGQISYAHGQRQRVLGPQMHFFKRVDFRSNSLLTF